MLMDLVEQAGFPPGVFNVVQGLGEEVGAVLVNDPRVRRISFTGSPETGRIIGQAAAKNLVPFTAELGGKGAFIVCADADIDAAAQKAAVMFDDGGQVCLAGTRLLVHNDIYDTFVELLGHYVRRHVIGDSRDSSTTLSPLIHPEHLARVDGFVQRARDNGDQILFGGRATPEGLWYEPTVIVPVSNESEVVQHEIFGPVLALQQFSTDEEAVALANSTAYGLSSIVYTSSDERAQRIGSAIRAGTVWVNCFLVRDLTAPFGGIGISGVGREGGDYALDFYSDLQMLQIKEGTTHG
jgi:betaine-aldehyde dehydrogenase/5-carboxymethyl-2-hydroxymuconic-semialdehyde dehydrogenase